MSVKEVSDELIKIAYSEKSDRYSLVQDLKSKLDKIPTSEIQQSEKVLISQILDDILNDAKEPNIAIKVVNKKPKKETEIIVKEPEIIVEKPKPAVVVSEPQPTIEIPNPIDEDLSFLDDIDNAF